MNIILIILDCVRPDFLYNKKIAPFLNSLVEKEELIQFYNVIAPATWTAPSTASILTGKYPNQHGVHEPSSRKVEFFWIWGVLEKVPKRIKTIASILKKLGYYTYLLSNNPWISPYFGYRDFDLYIDKLSITNWFSDRLFNISNEKIRREITSIYNRKGMLPYLFYLVKYPSLMIRSFLTLCYLFIHKYPLDKGVSRTVKFVKNIHLKEPFFMLIFLVDTHESYVGGRYSKKGYIKAIKYVDSKLKELLDILKKKIDYDNTLIIVTADHGQLFGEYGIYGHGGIPVKELVQVPLLLKPPKNIKIIGNPKGYFSLTKIPILIGQALDGYIDFSKLYSEEVYVESFCGGYKKYKASELLKEGRTKIK